jgi:demethylmenaquinone methyltransferase / 2-methoxy-6-polyprenyl-1,4-benzoquinol methylase
MFDGLVERYDLLNRLISLGLDRGWRRAAIRAVAPAASDRILDLGCGTGDLLALVAGERPVGANPGAVRAQASAAPGGVWPVGVDVSAAMLGRARGRLGERAGLVRGSAFELPFGSGVFQGAVSAFVLRNLRDLERAMAELARVLAPGARIALLDATEPHPALRPAFDLYFRLAAPALGALAGRRGAYQYLAASLAQIPTPAEMCRLLAAAGFAECAARPLTLGMVTLFTARRP